MCIVLQWFSIRDRQRQLNNPQLQAEGVISWSQLEIDHDPPTLPLDLRYIFESFLTE